MESLGRTPFIMHICRHDIHELNLKHYDLTLICRQTAKTSLLSGYRSFVPPPRYCRKSACRFSILCVLVLYKRLLTAARNKNRSMMTIRVKTVRHQHVIRMKHENLPILNKVYITVYIISCSKPALFEITAAIFTFECIKNKTPLFRTVMLYQYCTRLYDILPLGFVRHSVGYIVKNPE